MPTAGPKWYNQLTGAVLAAARREETCGLAKTKGDYLAEGRGAREADLLARWRRNQQAWIHCLGEPSVVRARTSVYVNDHPVLKYLGKKIADFLHDYHRDWFPRLGLPPSNGQHEQLTHFHIKKLLRSLYKSQDLTQDRPEIWVYSRLEIGHKDYSGRHFVYCKPFKEFHDDLRMDCVFFVPPPPVLYRQKARL